MAVRSFEQYQATTLPADDDDLPIGDTLDADLLAINDMLAMPAPGAHNIHQPNKIRHSPEQKAFIKLEVCTRLSKGEHVNAVYSELQTNPAQLKRWATDDADFGREWFTAKELNNEFLSESLVGIHNTHFNPAMAKVQSENVKWVLGVRDRSKYGNKVEVSDSNSGQLVDVLKMAISRIPRPNASSVRPELELRAVDPDIVELLAIPHTNT